MLFNLISKIPMVKITSPDGLVLHNQLVLGLGILVYLILGALVYFNKLPASIVTQLPTTDLRYLVGFMFIDYLVYFGLHRFQYGIPPPLTMGMLQKASVGRQIGGGESDQPQPGPPPGPPMGPVPTGLPPEEDDSSELDIPDDLSSTLKVSGRQRQPPVSEADVGPPPAPREYHLPPGRFTPPAPPPDDFKSPEAEEQPQEASLPGGDFFPEEESKAVIENWDTDEYTHEEYIPDKL